jgi:hypothetical protein
VQTVKLLVLIEPWLEAPFVWPEHLAEFQTLKGRLVREVQIEFVVAVLVSFLVFLL